MADPVNPMMPDLDMSLPGAAVSREPSSWWDAASNAAALQPVYQAIGRAYETFGLPDDPDYNPFKGDTLKGFEAYADDFIDVRSQREADLLKARIIRNEERRRVVEDYDGWSPALIAELVNPVNMLPFGAITRGAGFIRGGLRVGAATGGLIAGEEGLRQVVDPTATREESINNIIYGSLFGALLGGAGGMIGAKDAARFAREYPGYWKGVETSAEPGAPIENLAGVIDSGTGFVARPTGNVPTGVASAFGLEKQTNITSYGKLKNSGIRALGDFADAMLGDFGVLSAQNRVNLPTENSAYLASHLWTGQAADAISGVRRAYVRYLGEGGDGGKELVGLNLRAVAAQLGDLGRRGGARADGKLTFEQFQDAVFRAHKRNGIETDDPFVREGVEAVRGFFDKALVEGVKSGAIRSSEGVTRLIQRRSQRMRQAVARYEELTAKTDRTINDTIELTELERQQAQFLREADQFLDAPAREDADLAAILDEIDAKTAAKQSENQRLRDEFLAKGEQQRDRAADLLADIETSIAARVEKDQAILDYLNRAYAERGLTDAQIAYRDLLEERLAAGDNFDEIGARPGSLAQQRATDALKAQLLDVEGRAARAEAMVDTFNFNFDPEASAGGTLYHGTNLEPRLLLQMVDENGDLVLQPGENFGLVGISFATQRNHAAAYATGLIQGSGGKERIGRVTRPRVRNAVVFQIDTDALPKLDVEVAGERAAFGADPIRVPAGRWKATDAVTGEVIPLADVRKADAKTGLTERQRAFLDELEARIEKQQQFSGPKNEPFYLPRVWDLEKVVDDEAGDKALRGILTKWFRDNPLPGASLKEEAIAGRVDDAIRSILKEAETGDLQIGGGGGAPSFSASRKIDIPNELVADFIDTNPEHLMRTYSHRFGVAQEVARKFGSVDARDAIDDTLLQAIREMNFADPADAMKQIEALRGDLEWTRDKLTGAVYSNDPALMNKRRLASGVRAWGSLTSMGKAALASIPEVGRGLMVNGVGRTFGFLMDGMLGNAEAFGKVSKELRALTGEGLDVVMSSAVNRFVETGGPNGATTGMLGKAGQRMQSFASGPYFLLNGLAFVTDITKRMNLTFINQFMLEDIHLLAAGKGGKKLAERLASYGLSAEDAEKIVTMPLEKEGKIFLPNVAAWPDQDLAMRYLGAVQGMSRRIVPSAGLADVPEIAKGFVKGREFPLLTLPFQFMNYGFAAANKVALSALQGRDANPVLGAAALAGLGYLVEMAVTPDWAWDKMDGTERMTRAVDRSGVTGIYSNVNSLVETASLGNVGMRPALGLQTFNRDPTVPDAVADTLGPGPSKVYDLTRIFIDGDMTEKQAADAVRRSIPLNNLFYWDGLWKDAQKWMLEDEPEGG